MNWTAYVFDCGHVGAALCAPEWALNHKFCCRCEPKHFFHTAGNWAATKPAFACASHPRPR